MKLKNGIFAVPILVPQCQAKRIKRDIYRRLQRKWEDKVRERLGLPIPARSAHLAVFPSTADVGLLEEVPGGELLDPSDRGGLTELEVDSGDMDPEPSIRIHTTEPTDLESVASDAAVTATLLPTRTALPNMTLPPPAPQEPGPATSTTTMPMPLVVLSKSPRKQGIRIRAPLTEGEIQSIYMDLIQHMTATPSQPTTTVNHDEASHLPPPPQSSSPPPKVPSAKTAKRIKDKISTSLYYEAIIWHHSNAKEDSTKLITALILLEFLSVPACRQAELIGFDSSRPLQWPSLELATYAMRKQSPPAFDPKGGSQYDQSWTGKQWFVVQEPGVVEDDTKQQDSPDSLSIDYSPLQWPSQLDLLNLHPGGSAQASRSTTMPTTPIHMLNFTLLLPQQIHIVLGELFPLPQPKTQNESSRLHDIDPLSSLPIATTAASTVLAASSTTATKRVRSRRRR